MNRLKKGYTLFYFQLTLIALASNSCKVVAQTENESRIEKKLYNLYHHSLSFGNKWKKCNKVAKRYIKRHEKDDVAYASACYYAALSYLKYDMWDFNRRNVLNDRAWIMDRKPLNYIDSAFRYNQLFMEAAGTKLSDTAHKWRHELFPELYFEVWTQTNQRINHEYSGVAKEHIYKNNKEEIDNMIGWYQQLVEIAHDYLPWFESPLYIDLLNLKFDCGIPISTEELIKMRILVDEQVTTYKCGENVPGNMFTTSYCRDELEMLFELDTALFFDYVRMYERNGIQVNFGPSSHFYDDEEIWKFENNRIDLGTIYISDSARYIANAFDTIFSINILTEIFPGDTLRFSSIRREHESRFEIMEFADSTTYFTSGLKENQLQLKFKLKYDIYVNNEHQWARIEERYFVTSNRGSDNFFLIYRLNYQN